jgi:hypothetical protein
LSFVDHIDFLSSIRGDKPSRKKPVFAVNEKLRQYLHENEREMQLPVSYRDLTGYSNAIALKDKTGKDTLWETVMYDTGWQFIREGLLHIYAILKTEGNLSFIKHLDVARVDYCTFGNSNPFRIRIVNKFNDNYDHYYIKQADSSRIYGLELEHILSPNTISFFTHKNTMIEEHIAGIPGDIFIDHFMKQPTTNLIRLAKEFVKFNERCFVRLLGDMRSYNFVVDITPDVEDYQYRIRAIDFDQQCYEGRRTLYMPQFFKENKTLVELCLNMLDKDSIDQYQVEERTMIAYRFVNSRGRIKQLVEIMMGDHISTPEKTSQLANELSGYFHQPDFLNCSSMGQVLKMQLEQTLKKYALSE